MENIIKKLNEIDENPLMKKEVKQLCRAYAAEVVRYFEARKRNRNKERESVRGG
ncbi:MAG: hypothetical protein QNI89_15095 [Desulfobacterales bacterium]|nr:hypothetical protein [Desulfobacterales bacterium]MDJ0888634.1 hypothetical protein [Desulfobacterales bacterium]MDJ0988432.1 hypothetical protein [Desulfobacterales bacterium]